MRCDVATLGEKRHQAHVQAARSADMVEADLAQDAPKTLHFSARCGSCGVACTRLMQA